MSGGVPAAELPPVCGQGASQRPIHQRGEGETSEKQEVGRADAHDGSVQACKQEEKQLWHWLLQLGAGDLYLCDSGLGERPDQRGASLGAVVLMLAIREQRLSLVSHHGGCVEPSRLLHRPVLAYKVSVQSVN